MLQNYKQHKVKNSNKRTTVDIQCQSESWEKMTNQHTWVVHGWWWPYDLNSSSIWVVLASTNWHPV